MAEPIHSPHEQTRAARGTASASEPTQPAVVAEDAHEDGRALLQGYAMAGLLFFSLVLGAMLGSLVAGEWGAGIGCLAAPLLLVLLWRRRSAPSNRGGR